MSPVCFTLRVAVLDKVTDFLLFLGKLLIVGIVGRKTLLKAQNTCNYFKMNGGKKNLYFSSTQVSSLSSSSLEKSKQWRMLPHL